MHNLTIYGKNEGDSTLKMMSRSSPP